MEEKVKKRMWVKNIAIIFLLVMLVLTFFSNTILNRSLPEAATALVEPNSIDSKVRVSGTVSAKENYDVILEQSRKVVSVAVKVGQEVSTGDVLFTLEPGDSDELESAKEALHALELQYQKAVINADSNDYTREKRNIELAQAEVDRAQARYADYALTTAELSALEKSIAAAQKSYDEASIGVKNSADSSGGTGGGATSSQTTALQQAKAQLQAAEAALRSAKSYYASGYTQLENEAKQRILDDYNAAHPSDTKSSFSQLSKAEQDKLDYYIQTVAEKYAPKENVDTDAYYTAYTKIAKAQKAYNDAEEALRYAEAAYNDSQTAVNQAKKEAAEKNRTDAKRALTSVQSYYSSEYAELEKLAKEKLIKEYNDANSASLTINDYGTLPSEYKDKLGDYIELIAESKLITFEQEIDPRYTAYVQVSEAKKAVDEAERAVSNAQASINDANSFDDYTPGKSYGGKSHSQWLKLQADAELQLDQLKAQKAAYDEAYTALDAAEEHLRNLQDALEDAQRGDRLEYLDMKELQRQIEDAKLDIEKLETGDDATEIKAKVSGTVQNLAVSAGHTANAGEVLATIEVSDLGYTMTATVTNEQARLLHVGDTAAVSNFYWGASTEAEITAIRPDPKNPQSGKLLMFDITGDVAAGSTLSFSIGQKNANYDMVVPNSAVRSDTTGSFVLIITAKNSPLGNRYYATRVDVEVVASDDFNSAIKGALEGYETVITATSNNAPLKNGDQVRLPDVN